jgi:glycerol-3-phosphate acyltransferase PlsY
MIFAYILLLLSYLIGAIPFSVIFGKIFKGIDVRKHGSGNPGGTNSLRFLGKKVGALVIFFDILKGAIVIILIRLNVFGDVELLHPLAYGFIASFGHAFSPFIKFRGGKAVGTTAGTYAAYSLWNILFGAVVFLLILKTTKFVSIASSGVAILVVIISLFSLDIEVISYGLLTMTLIIYRHKQNYKNILNKVEPKVTWI